MRAIHVIPGIITESSGPAQSVPRLCAALARRGVDVELDMLRPLPEKCEFGNLRGHGAWRLSGRFGYSPEMAKYLKAAATGAEIMHNHSLWMMPNIYPAHAVRGKACRLIVSPRGTLSRYALRRSRWLKWPVWHLGQRAALFSAAGLHATSEAEYGDIRRLGIKAPVAIIPNGTEIPEEGATRERGAKRRVLFLGRLHPTKGVDLLLKAWRALGERRQGWELVIAGPLKTEYSVSLKKLAVDLGVESVSFAGEVTGEGKGALYRSADLFVLPSHSENFGIAVAEALAHGVPAIVTKGAPWPGLEREGCGWWIEQGVESLAATMREAMAKGREELGAMGARGREWMRRDYSWDRGGGMMLGFYMWLLGRGERPEWVVVD